MWRCEQWDLVAHADDSAVLCCCLLRDLSAGQWRMAALYD